MARRKTQPHSAEEPHPCSVSGCGEPAYYRAPASREQLHEYHWMCLDHVREFNRSWNYFEGMESTEIEGFMQDALTGHRPTWKREEYLQKNSKKYMDALEEGLARFFRWDADDTRRANRERLPARERKALAELDLEDRVTTVELKAHYRKLVKRHHPDLHGGNLVQEETFKRINAAYAYLLKLYAE